MTKKIHKQLIPSPFDLTLHKGMSNFTCKKTHLHVGV